jgi:predicted HD phosphohydrolase
MKTKNNAESNTANAVRTEAMSIAENFVGQVVSHEEWHLVASILRDIPENYIASPCTLREVGDLLHEIADESERLGDDNNHEAEICESLCKKISQILSVKHDKHIGRA